MRWMHSIQFRQVAHSECRGQKKSVTMTQINIIKLLTFLGIVPFFLSPFAVVFSETLPLHVAQKWTISYGAIIISFISGSHWSLVQSSRGEPKPVILFESNFIALVAWLTLFLGTIYSICVLLLCFAYLLSIEKRFCRDNNVPSWYFKLRVQVTTLVCILLVSNIFLYVVSDLSSSKI